MNLKTLDELEWNDEKIQKDIINRLNLSCKKDDINLNEWNDLVAKNKSAGNHVDSNELRAEAIRWVKALNLDFKKFIDSLDNNTQYELKHKEFQDEWGYDNLVDWIKHFFNLSDEDIEGD